MNPEYELWFEVSVIDSVERNGNTFIMREMHTYSVSDRILTSLELPQINKVIEKKLENDIRTDSSPVSYFTYAR